MAPGWLGLLRIPTVHTQKETYLAGPALSYSGVLLGRTLALDCLAPKGGSFRHETETSRRDPSGAGAWAWRATSGCSLTSLPENNYFRRFPTHVAVARASEFVLRKGAGA